VWDHPLDRKCVTGQLGLFCRRKGKAGPAMDSSSGLFLTAIQAAAMLLAALPVTLGHFRGLGTVDGLACHMPCNTARRLQDVQPELLVRLALDGLSKLQSILLEEDLMGRRRGGIFSFKA